MTMPITVTILSLNEGRKLRPCLESVQWADEVIVVDSGSTDETESIAHDAGARFVRHDWEGYGLQKNFAAELSSNNWILNLDADERISSELAMSIRDANGAPAAYSMNRVSDFLSRPHRPLHRARGDFQVRFYDRTRAAFTEAVVHERVVPLTASDHVELLAGAILHEGFRSVDDLVSRINRYSTLLVEERPQKSSVLKLFGRPLARLALDLVYQGHLRDGWRGLSLSMIWAGHDFLVELKRLEADLPRRGAFEGAQVGLMGERLGARDE